MSHLSRGAISLLLVVAWLIASNHCAVAGLGLSRPAPSTAEHCTGHGTPKQPEKEKNKGCDPRNCCKSLTVPAVVLAKSPVSFNQFDFAKIDYLAVLPLARGEAHPTIVFELDTGPPTSSSFAESVLQRSLLAHAPPRFA